MVDPIQLLNALKRPKLLLDAVAHGLHDYRRAHVLKRVMGSAMVPGPRRAMTALLAIEEELESARRARESGYNASRHIEALVALISEARTVSSEAAREQREAVVEPDLRHTGTQ